MLVALALAIGCSSAPPEREAPRSAVPEVEVFAVRAVEIGPVDAARAEDGRGATVAAVDPAAIDVLADAWPGRAEDPVLEVGDLRFRHYSHPAPGVLRFVVADRSAIPEGAPMAIRWGALFTVVPR